MLLLFFAGAGAAAPPVASVRAYAAVSFAVVNDAGDSLTVLNDAGSSFAVVTSATPSES